MLSPVRSEARLNYRFEHLPFVPARWTSSSLDLVRKVLEVLALVIRLNNVLERTWEAVPKEDLLPNASRMILASTSPSAKRLQTSRGIDSRLVFLETDLDSFSYRSLGMI